MALDHMPKMPKRYLHQKQLITNEPLRLRRLIPSKIPRCKYIGIHASRFGVWCFFVILIIIIIVIVITVSLFYHYHYV